MADDGLDIVTTISCAEGSYISLIDGKSLGQAISKACLIALFWDSVRCWNQFAWSEFLGVDAAAART